MDEAIEALFDPEGFPSKSDGCFNGSADDGIQGWAISAAREDPYSHVPLLLSRLRRLFLKRSRFQSYFIMPIDWR